MEMTPETLWQARAKQLRLFVSGRPSCGTAARTTSSNMARLGNEKGFDVVAG